MVLPARRIWWLEGEDLGQHLLGRNLELPAVGPGRFLKHFLCRGRHAEAIFFRDVSDPRLLRHGAHRQRGSVGAGPQAQGTQGFVIERLKSLAGLLQVHAQHDFDRGILQQGEQEVIGASPAITSAASLLTGPQIDGPRVKNLRSMCGCALAIRTPAASARCRRRRVAAWRSIRVPRLLSGIGPPVRVPIARSMARPTAGGSGIKTTLVPLPHTRRTRRPCSSPRSAISALVASKIRRPSSLSMATRAKAHGSVESRAAVSRASNCRWVNPGWVILGAPRAAGRARPGSAPAGRR
jgi:hypothetical protein